MLEMSGTGPQLTTSSRYRINSETSEDLTFLLQRNHINCQSVRKTAVNFLAIRRSVDGLIVLALVSLLFMLPWYFLVVRTNN